jgi:hypothetical protein
MDGAPVIFQHVVPFLRKGFDPSIMELMRVKPGLVLPDRISERNMTVYWLRERHGGRKRSCSQAAINFSTLI